MITNLTLKEISGLTEDEARELLEKERWNGEPACPHCGGVEPYKLTPKVGSKTRKGLWKCKACRKQFTVTVGTVFEGSRIPIKTWLMAVSLIVSSKKGISAHQIHRMFGVTYKTAWFMMHRIRYAMTQPVLKAKLEGVVECDETYLGGRRRGGKRGRGTDKMIVVSLVERKGEVVSKSFDMLTANELQDHIKEQVDKEARIMTDEFKSYRGLDKHFREHQTVKHGNKEYVRGEVYTNTAEGFFSLLKRGVNGTFHHISKQHLPFYLNEFDFRWNNRYIN